MKATVRCKLDTIKKRAQVWGMDLPSFVRKVLVAWLLAVTVEYLLLPAQWRDLAELGGLARMSGLRMLLITGAVTIGLTGLSRLKKAAVVERWALGAVFAVLAITAVVASFTWAFLAVCLLVLGIMVVYGRFGWDSSPEPVEVPQKNAKLFGWLTIAMAVAMFLLISVWTASKIYCYCVPTYDFGLFAQMFHNMKEMGLPMTTLERDGWMSHFDVHVSPIYYLMLPFYALVPTPATLQVLQAAVMASAALPLWKIGKHHGLSGLQRMLLCALLLVYPAFAGGASYDLHENCFLTALILWMFYGIDKKNTVLTSVAAVLTLMVKEDAAVYVAVIALWLIVKTLVRLKNGDKWSLIMGAAMLAVSLGWFFAVTSYLAGSGDGVMTYRYRNFFFDGSTSLITVIKAVLLNPLKAVYECVDPEKLKYIVWTMVPLLGLPLLTRRYERYLLLIPYILINLMSDYVYQHDIMFQYNFGSIAFMLYLTAINLSEVKIDRLRTIALATAVMLGAVGFAQKIMPEAVRYPKYVHQYRAYYQQIEKTLDTIPEDATVAASAYYTTQLSQRKTIYDVYYCSREHLLESEYVALSVKLYNDYAKFATPGEDDGFQRLVEYLEENGYELYNSMDGVLVIYRKTQP